MIKLKHPTSGEIIEIEVQIDEIGKKRVEVDLGETSIYLDIEYGVKPSKPLYHDREWLSNEYHGKNRTMAEISRQFGVTPMTIQQWLRQHDIPTRSRGRRNT